MKLCCEKRFEHRHQQTTGVLGVYKIEIENNDESTNNTKLFTIEI